METRSFLFVTWEGGGNVPPVLGVVRRLAGRGHVVRVLTEPAMRAAVERAGAAFIPFTRHFVREDVSRDLIGDWTARTPLGALQRTFANVVFGPAAIVAEETRWALEAAPTAAVVADALMPGALVAAEAAGVSRVVLFHMPEYLPGPGRPAAGPGFLPRNDLLGRLRDGLLERAFYSAVRRHLPAYNQARREAGLAPLATARDLVGEYHRADLRLIQTSEAFDFPIRPAPSNVRYVGPILDDPEWVEPWESPWPADDRRPLVVVSLSSTFQRQADVLQRVAAALGRLDVRGLFTLGPAMAGQALALPENVIAVSSAPHSGVFLQAAAVVTHAGHGTVMRALAAGLPLLCLPMGRDQDDNAARVVAAGAGLRLRAGASPTRIATAVGALLGEERYRIAAERMSGLIAADAALDRATAELESLAETSRRTARQPAAAA
jgi:UDP:flavonoid glycosyltransferase YjiC (YdhE family)